VQAGSLACDDHLVDDAIQVFVTQARAFCLLVESEKIENSWVFAHTCLSQLLRLYDAALYLPEVEASVSATFARVDNGATEQLRKQLGQRLARDYYWEVFEPLEMDKPEALVGSLSDDLADIWGELKSGLAAADGTDPSSLNDAVWCWRFSFETHWGHHAAGAINALHALCFGGFADVDRP